MFLEQRMKKTKNLILTIVGYGILPLVVNKQSLIPRSLYQNTTQYPKIINNQQDEINLIESFDKNHRIKNSKPQTNFLQKNLCLLAFIGFFFYLYLNFHKLSLKKKIILTIVCIGLLSTFLFGPLSLIFTIAYWMIKGCFFVVKSVLCPILFFGLG